MTRRTRKKGYESIIWMLFALVAIILVMWQLQQQHVSQPPELELLSEQQRIAVVDSVYFHLPLYFTWRLPNKDWRFISVSYDSIFQDVDTTSSIRSQINWMVHAEKMSVPAQVRVGVLSYKDTPDVKNTAISLLYEFLDQSESHAELITPVTTGAHHVLIGEYFLVRMQNEHDEVWVVSVLPRKSRLYVIENRVAESFYSSVRLELERCVSQFRALSML